MINVKGEIHMEKYKKGIEDFIEKRNGIIQLVILLGFIVVGALYGFGLQEELPVMIEILGIIVMELLILNVKDSIMHQKMNRIGVRIEMEDGALFRVADFEIDKFFKNAEKQLFVSGIALNGFFSKFRGKIVEMLSADKEVWVLIADPKTVSENTKLYYGTSSNAQNSSAEKVRDILAKQRMTLSSIRSDGVLYNKFLNGKLKIKIAQSVFSTSFVAYDLLIRDGIKRTQFREIKASFYQYKCTESKDEPNILLNSRHNKDWYDFFKNTAQMQWEDAKHITGDIEFEKLYASIEDEEKKYSKVP